MSLLYQIETCLRITRLPPSRFGRDAVKDPRIVHDLRRGRQPGARMEARIRSYIRSLLDEACPQAPADPAAAVAEPQQPYGVEGGQ
jgi:hypothetical protein